jgi:hypothetical protein
VRAVCPIVAGGDEVDECRCQGRTCGTMEGATTHARFWHHQLCQRGRLREALSSSSWRGHPSCAATAQQSSRQHRHDASRHEEVMR